MSNGLYMVMESGIIYYQSELGGDFSEVIRTKPCSTEYHRRIVKESYAIVLPEAPRSNTVHVLCAVCNHDWWTKDSNYRANFKSIREGQTWRK